MVKMNGVQKDQNNAIYIQCLGAILKECIAPCIPLFVAPRRMICLESSLALKRITNDLIVTSHNVLEFFCRNLFHIISKEYEMLFLLLIRFSVARFYTVVSV